MDLIGAISKAKNQGPFLLLTERDVEAFSDLDKCEERITLLGGQPFAVVSLLWTGGAEEEARAVKPDDDSRQVRPEGNLEPSVKAQSPKTTKNLYGRAPTLRFGRKQYEGKGYAPITLTEGSIRTSLEELVKVLKAGDVIQAGQALETLDYGRLLRTVHEPGKATPQPSNDSSPAFGTHRVRLVGDYLSNLSYHLDSGNVEAAGEEAEKALKCWFEER